MPEDSTQVEELNVEVNEDKGKDEKDLPPETKKIVNEIITDCLFGNSSDVSEDK